MKGYWIISVDIHNIEKFKLYADMMPAIFAKYQAEFLVRAGRQVIVEGAFSSRNTIVVFNSYQDALDCYCSDEYQAVIQLRPDDVATMNLMIIEGV